MKSKILIVIPSPVDSIDGVSAYGNILGDLLSKQGYKIEFTVPRNAKIHVDNLRDFNCIILNYVGYGYSKKGIPYNLIKALKNAKKQNVKIITFFHELDAEGKVLSSANILAPIQRIIIRKIADLSDSIVVSNAKFYDRLVQINNWINAEIHILPVFSNIGEANSPKSFEEREEALVIFGTVGRREASYSRLSEDIIKKLSINKIYDIGKDSLRIPRLFSKIVVEKLGEIESTKVFEILKKVRFGALSYPECVLAKSGILASYATNGVVPIILPTNYEASDEVKEGVHYLTEKSIEGIDNSTKYSIIQNNIVSWYNSHNYSVHKDLFVSLIKKEKTKIKKRVLTLSILKTQNEAPARYLTKSSDNLYLHAFCVDAKNNNYSSEEFLNQKQTRSIKNSYYPSITLKNISFIRSLNSRLCLINPGVLRLVATSDSCIIYGHFYITFILSILFSIILNKRIFLTTDTDNKTPSFIKRCILRFLYNKIAHKVFVPSTITKLAIESIGIRSEKVIITPYSIDEEFFQDCFDSSKSRKIRDSILEHQNQSLILFCGKLIARKGVQDLLKAIRNIENIKLVIIGDGPLRIELEEFCFKENIIDKVIFAGFVSYVDLANWYQAADIVVHPAKEEPFGLVILEAIIAGTYVIASDAVGSTKDLIIHEKSGYIYPSGNLEELSKAIRKAVTNPDMRWACSDKAKEILNTWNSKNNAKIIDDAVC